MRRFLIFILAAVLFELLAMTVRLEQLPGMAGVVFGAIAAVSLLASVWEKPKPDERDRLIVWRSSHIAFLSVATVLAGVLLYQTINHELDPWLLVTIGVLVIGKLVGRLYIQRRS